MRRRRWRRRGTWTNRDRRVHQAHHAAAASDGWDERQDFDYETSPNERAVVTSITHRIGTMWTVFIVHGSESSVEKRGASIDLISESLRPKGYQR